jgi:hypothetical protein
MIKTITDILEALRNNAISIEDIALLLQNESITQEDVLQLPICKHCKLKILTIYYENKIKELDQLSKKLVNGEHYM